MKRKNKLKKQRSDYERTKYERIECHSINEYIVELKGGAICSAINTFALNGSP